MAKKKIKMTDTKVRVVVVTVILLAFILSLYFIFREPDNIKCPKGQVPQNGKCVPAPCSTIAQQNNNYFCTSENMCERRNGECRDCEKEDGKDAVLVIPSYVTTEQSGSLFNKLIPKPLVGFGASGPDGEKKICTKTCSTDNDCNTTAGEVCAPANFGEYSPSVPGVPVPKVCTGRAKWECFADEKSCPDVPTMYYKDGEQRFRGCTLSSNSKSPGTGVCKQVPRTYNSGSDTLGKCQQTCKCGFDKLGQQTHLNSDNNACNTLPCTKDAVGGWGADIKKGDGSIQSTLFEYRPPEKNVNTTTPGGGHCLDVNEKDGTLLPWTGVSSCNGITNEVSCLNQNKQFHKCKWFDAGSCVRVAPKDKDGHVLKVRDDKDVCSGLCTVSEDIPVPGTPPSWGIPTATAPPGFKVNCSHYRKIGGITYPKVLDVATEVSNCTFKIDARYPIYNDEYNKGNFGDLVDGKKRFILVNVPSPVEKTGSPSNFNFEDKYLQYKWDNFMSGKEDLLYINLCESCTNGQGDLVTVGNNYTQGIASYGSIIATEYQQNVAGENPVNIQTNTSYRLGTPQPKNKQYFQMCDATPVKTASQCGDCSTTKSYQNIKLTTEGYYFQKIYGKDNRLNRDTTNTQPLRYGDVVNIMTGTPETPETPGKAESCIVACGSSPCGGGFTSYYVVNANGSPQNYINQNYVYWAIISPKMFLENRKRKVCPASYSQNQLVETSFNPLEYRRCNNGLTRNPQNNFSGTMFPTLVGSTLAQSSTFLTNKDDNDWNRGQKGETSGNYCHKKGSDTRCGFQSGQRVFPQADWYAPGTIEDSSQWWCNRPGSTNWRGDLKPTIVTSGNFGAGEWKGDYNSYNEDAYKKGKCSEY
jgi:hypothetical protein